MNTENKVLAKHAVSVLLPTIFNTFLVVSRKDDLNDFGLPGGKVDPGESLEQAAIRELYEETGHEVDMSTLSLIFTAPPIGDGKYFDHVFLVSEYYNVDQVNEAGVVKTLSSEDLMEGKTFGEYNKRLFAYVEQHNLQLPAAKFVPITPIGE